MPLPGHRISILHVVILTASLALTITAWQYSKAQTEIRVAQRFEASKDNLIGLIRDRMQKYEDALWSGVAAIESHGGTMTLQEWKAFSAHLRIDEKYPGINGLGVIHVLSDDTLGTYLQQRRAERADFSIFPPHDQDFYMPISFIEPEASNAQAIGLDIAHEMNRRQAALASRSSGQAQISGPIVLVQDAGATAGFLFFAPFFSNGTLSGSDGSSAAIHEGIVYAPFVVRNLMDGLLAKDQRDTSISITDAGETIYNEHSADEGLHDPKPMFSEEISMELYGRTWILDIRSNLSFRDRNAHIQPTMILVGGVVIEALIVMLLITMARTSQNAVAYADRVTEDLRTEQQKLKRSNEELERFAYAASHDLRTPVRGIGGLTEMIKEDLEDYFNSPDANPEVANNIDLISDRVQRMQELTNGIIEFSKIGTQSSKCAPLQLEETVSGMLSDFNLLPEQIALNSSVRVVDVDPIGLRRVLENLVGNAVKYHDAPDKLKIVITCEEASDFLEFSVSDNGPGIAREYQGRVFEMFQTMRLPNSPESSGIGLAIVKKAVEVHGGKVSLSSESGCGAKFCFQWPRNLTDAKQLPFETPLEVGL